MKPLCCPLRAQYLFLSFKTNFFSAIIVSLEQSDETFAKEVFDQIVDPDDKSIASMEDSARSLKFTCVTTGYRLPTAGWCNSTYRVRYGTWYSNAH
jgi:hypothetical protein